MISSRAEDHISEKMKNDDLRLLRSLIREMMMTPAWYDDEEDADSQHRQDDASIGSRENPKNRLDADSLTGSRENPVTVPDRTPPSEAYPASPDPLARDTGTGLSRKVGRA